MENMADYYTLSNASNAPGSEQTAQLNYSLHSQLIYFLILGLHTFIHVVNAQKVLENLSVRWRCVLLLLFLSFFLKKRTFDLDPKFYETSLKLKVKKCKLIIHKSAVWFRTTSEHAIPPYQTNTKRVWIARTIQTMLKWAISWFICAQICFTANTLALRSGHTWLHLMRLRAAREFSHRSHVFAPCQKHARQLFRTACWVRGPWHL